MVKKVKPPLSPGAHFLQGDVACAEGALAAGCRFFAGYPITPASEVMTHICKRFEELGHPFIQMEDEIASISAVIGAAWTGAKAMTATSGPGLSLMLESVGFAVITETPCVIVDVQRAGPSTGQATRPGQGDVQQVKWGSHGDCGIIALAPWSVQEMFDLTVRAFNLAELFRVPVFVLSDESVGHMSETVRIPDEIEVEDRDQRPGVPPFATEDPAGVPPMPSFGRGERLLVTSSTHDAWGRRRTQDSAVQDALVRRLNAKIDMRAAEIVEVHRYMWDDAEVGIVSFGVSARAAAFAVETLRKQGVKAGLLRLKTLWPFPDDTLRRETRGKRVLFVPEMNLGQVTREVRRVVEGALPVHAITKVNGEPMRVDDILRAVAGGPAAPRSGEA